MRKAMPLGLVAVPAIAGIALAACGSAAGTATPGSAASGRSGPAASGMPMAGQPPDMQGVVASAWAGLVDDGTITAEQQTAVATAFEGGTGGPPQASPPASQQPAQQPGQPHSGAGDLIATVVAGLVEDGTLTKAQGEAVTQALSQMMPGGRGARAPPDAGGGDSI